MLKSPPDIGVVSLTEAEYAVLMAAEHIKFGELLEVDLPEGPVTKCKVLAPAQNVFISVIRAEGLLYLKSITVHNGMPQQIEVAGTSHGVKYRRKIRF